DIEACSAHDRNLIHEFKFLKRCHEEILETRNLEHEMSQLQEREHQLSNQITQYHMMCDNEMREKMQNEQEFLNWQAKFKLRLEPIAKLYEKEKETYETLKENYEKVMESNIQQELERTELQNQLYTMHGLVQQLKEQNCDAD
ncbi:Chromosome partition protein MukB, partial [Clarias magur]